MTNNFDINNPPLGAWIRQEEKTLILGGSTQSLGDALMEIPFMIVWSGSSLGGLYGSQIYTGDFSLLMTIFGIPFLIASYVFGRRALMYAAGKIEVIIDEKNLKIFNGIGKMGRVNIYPLETIRIDVRERKGNSYLVLQSGKNDIIDYRTELKPERRTYLLKALQEVLDEKQNGKNFLQQDLSEHLL